MGKRDELNPAHPVTQAMSDQWHTLCALLLNRIAPDTLETVLTKEEIEQLSTTPAGPSPVLTVYEREDGLHLKLVSRAEGEAIAQAEHKQLTGGKNH